MAQRKTAAGGRQLLHDPDPFWYKDAIIYELHVRTFFDSDGDGMGDFRGLTEKLDYLQDLGVTALWLLPFYPSPWKDDGYDIADYVDVHPAYGTLADFRTFLREAHRRGLRVITELVINHTSDQHPWFQRARRSRPGTRWRDFYVWSDTPEKYSEARIIFQDFEPSNWAWDPVAKAYYWHRFYSQQPDLNFDNPRVHEAVFRAMDFWFRLGVDGMRLDAVPYLYEREGTNCENLPETHVFLKALRRHVDSAFPGRMLLAEANQWPEDAVSYFGEGDECHMSFHFPVMPRLYMALQMEDRFPIVDILEQTPPIPESCQWAIFLRNHDELTLEMVTDEERDYMYRVYAHEPQMRINLGIRRRLAPLLNNNRRKVELLNALLFSLPGTPVLYYGDEIGMGDNVFLGDRNGVRTPMQWSGDRNAGFSRANPQRLYLPAIIDPEYHFEAINVETQQANPNSLLWWMKHVVALRKRYRAFGRGTLEFVNPENRKVLAFVRRYERERLLVVVNLSRYPQPVELDLSDFAGSVPVELFGGSFFPRVTEEPYRLTLGPHSFYWFDLAPAEEAIRLEAPPAAPAELAVAGPWERVLDAPARAKLEEVLPAWFRERRWFGGKARRIRLAKLGDSVPVGRGGAVGRLVLVEVRYVEGPPETYVLPLAWAPADAGAAAERPWVVVARLEAAGRPGVLYDAWTDPAFGQAILDAIVRRRRLTGVDGQVAGVPTSAVRRLMQDGRIPDPAPLAGEQSNTSLVFGDRAVLKLIRRVEPGANPEVEVGAFLTARGFAHAPATAGSLEYRRPPGEASTLAVLQGYVPNEGDAWSYTQDVVGRFFEQALAGVVDGPPPAPPFSGAGLLEGSAAEVPEAADRLVGPYLESAWLLGRRTAELHRVLASDPDDPAFAPEPFGALYQRSRYQAMRNLTARVFELLEGRISELPEPVAAEVRAVRDLRGEVLRRFRSIVGRRLSAQRIRIHGDYHLGQVLYTGRDFAIIDFEGEPPRTVGERRLKRSALTDVAGMIRSFHYAAHAPLFRPSGALRPEDVPRLEAWARFWAGWVSAAFLRAYLEHAAGRAFLPEDREELALLLDIHLLEKAVYELGYELNNRPAWVVIPARGIRELLG